MAIRRRKLGLLVPSLAQSRQRLDPEKWMPAERPTPPGAGPQSLEPVFNQFLRCPLPPVAVTPDSLRQYYRGSLIPQNRLMTPSNLSSTSGSGGSTTAVSGSTTNNTTITTVVKALSASVPTPVLNPGDMFFATATMAKTFELLQIAVSSPARVQIYATQSEQTSDAGRPDTSPPSIGTTQNLIADVSLDTSPLSWNMTWIPVGANGDFPRTTNIYVTITNIASLSIPITATLLYVPNET